MREYYGLTELMRCALTINTLIQNKIFHYPQPFSWDNSKGKFVLPSGRFSLVPWLTINFFVIVWVAIVNSLVVLVAYHAKHYNDLNILQIFILMGQCLIVVSICPIALVFHLKCSDWVQFLNEILEYPPLRRMPSFIQWLRQGFYLENGTVDKFGILMCGFAGMSIISKVPLPLFVYKFKLDAPYHFFRIVLPHGWFFNRWINWVISVVRFFIGTWSMYEGIAMLRLHAMYIMMVFHVYRANLMELTQRTLTAGGILRYRCLYIKFHLANESLSIQLPVTLSVMYLVFILVGTISVLGLNELHWLFYLGIPSAGVSVFVGVVLFWDMAITLDLLSNRLKFKWRKGLIQVRNSLKRNIMRRMLKANRPIHVGYGSFGEMTIRTRRAYFFSLMEDFVGVILAVKDAEGIAS